MPYDDYFLDQVCIVTGAASGIGLALSRGLLHAGARVVMADRDTSRLGHAVVGLGAFGDRLQPFPVDVTVEEEVQCLVEDTAEHWGRLDMLFNNAGIPGTMPIGQATLGHWRRIVDVNLWGVLYGVHFALPIMRRQGHGHLVNTASVAGVVPPPYQALYCTTKYAVVGLSESLRLELEDEGIHVTVVCPGNVVSRIFGTPVLGEPIDVPPPPDALPAEEAAEAILAGVARKEGILVLPQAMHDLWRLYGTSPREAEEVLREIGRKRKAAFLAGSPVS